MYNFHGSWLWSNLPSKGPLALLTVHCPFFSGTALKWAFVPTACFPAGISRLAGVKNFDVSVSCSVLPLFSLCLSLSGWSLGSSLSFSLPGPGFFLFFLLSLPFLPSFGPLCIGADYFKCIYLSLCRGCAVWPASTLDISHISFFNFIFQFIWSSRDLYSYRRVRLLT